MAAHSSTFAGVPARKIRELVAALSSASRPEPVCRTQVDDDDYNAHVYAPATSSAAAFELYMALEARLYA